MKPTVTPLGHGLGWISDQPDQRDRIFKPTLTFKVARQAPPVDLRSDCPAVYDQGQLGSCTANALAAAFDFDRKKEGKNFLTPSRLFIYWNERDMEGTVDQDSGAMIRDGVKVLVNFGTPPESEWPYDITKFTDKPSAQVFADAEKNQALTYQRIVTPHADPAHDMIACLASGYPFVAGISVYESFESPEANKTGVIPLPTQNEALLGGHAILIVGYQPERECFIFRNSWGVAWGDQGYGYLPVSYLTNKGLASDMWLIQTVELS